MPWRAGAPLLCRIGAARVNHCVTQLDDYPGSGGESTQRDQRGSCKRDPGGRIQLVSSVKEPSVDVKLCLVFPREALSVPVMRHMLGDALRGLGADDDGLADLLLAVTEACTNVVRHGGPGRRYEVVASLGRRGCRIEVQNTWQGFAGGRIPGLRRRPWPGAAAEPRARRRGVPPLSAARCWGPGAPTPARRHRTGRRSTSWTSPRCPSRAGGSTSCGPVSTTSA